MSARIRPDGKPCTGSTCFGLGEWVTKSSKGVKGQHKPRVTLRSENWLPKDAEGQTRENQATQRAGRPEEAGQYSKRKGVRGRG